MPRRRAVPIPADRRAGRAVLVLALIAVLAACSVSAPTSPTGSANAVATGTGLPSVTPVDSTPVYAQVAAQVEALRGLKPTKSVAPVVVTPDDLRARLAADFDQANSAAGIDATQRTLIALDLLPAGSSLRQLAVDFRSSSAAAYYSGVDGQIYVVTKGGAPGPADRAAYARELTRALQDQNYHFGQRALAETHEGDRWLGLLGLIEGDAASTQNAWMQQYLTLDELGTVMGQGSDPAVIAAFQNAPPYLRETASFANQDGLGFVVALLASGGQEAVNAAFADPPDSTAQVIDPKGYLDQLPEASPPVLADVARALGAGWTSGGQDTLGMVRLRMWLHVAGVTPAVAQDAVDSWAGDRMEVFFGPNGATALAISVQFGMSVDAAAFAAAAAPALHHVTGVGGIAQSPSSDLVSIAIGPDQATVKTILTTLGG